MTRAGIVGIAIVLGLASASVAFGQGQPFNPLQTLKLNREDMAAASAAANELYESGAIGQVAEWSNDASGNSGRVKLLETFDQEGYDCRSVQHVVRTRGNPDPATLVVKSCLAEDGTWKLI